MVADDSAFNEELHVKLATSNDCVSSAELYFGMLCCDVSFALVPACHI